MIKTCINCQKEFKVKGKKRQETAKYCSKKCLIQFAQQKLVCCQCNKIFYKSNYQIQHKIKAFCSQECRSKYTTIKQCLFCDKDFKVTNHRKETAKYCSKECKKEYLKAAIVNCRCKVCGKDFAKLQWELNGGHKGIYCSSECYQQRSPQQKIICQCGKDFWAYQSRIKYFTNLYCSQKCYMKYGFSGRLTDRIPEDNAYELFSRKLRSSAQYLLWAKECRTRDDNKCAICGSYKQLTVHHKVSVNVFIQKHGFDKEKIEQDKLWFDTNNGITLCRTCHIKEHKIGD